MTEYDRSVIHLAGYASIAAVLALADWSGPAAWIAALPIVTIAVYVGVRLAVDELVARAHRRTPEPTPATDGGHRVETTGSDRKRSDQH